MSLVNNINRKQKKNKKLFNNNKNLPIFYKEERDFLFVYDWMLYRIKAYQSIKVSILIILKLYNNIDFIKFIQDNIRKTVPNFGTSKQINSYIIIRIIIPYSYILHI